MSNAVLKGNASGTGTVTLETPNTNSDRTIALPDSNGTVMVSGNMPAFSAYQSSAQTITGAVDTKVQFQSKEYDTANAFDATTNYRFTPQVAGYYQFNAGIAIPNSAGIVLKLYKNGSTAKYIANTYNLASYGAYGSGQVYLNGSTDYVEFYAYITTTQTLSTGSSLTYFSGVLVRSA